MTSRVDVRFFIEYCVEGGEFAAVELAGLVRDRVRDERGGRSRDRGERRVAGGDEADRIAECFRGNTDVRFQLPGMTIV